MSRGYPAAVDKGFVAMQRRTGTKGRHTSTTIAPKGSEQDTEHTERLTGGAFAFEAFDGDADPELLAPLNRPGFMALSARLQQNEAPAQKAHVHLVLKVCFSIGGEDGINHTFNLDLLAERITELQAASCAEHSGLSLMISGCFESPESDMERKFNLLYNPEESIGVFRATIPA